MFALFPQVICGFLFVIVLRSIHFKHAAEDFEIAWSDIDDLKADIIRCRVNTVVFAPAAAGAENHEGLIGDLIRQLDAKIEIVICRDWFLAVEFEASGADIG